ncbi:MAG: efflux RND transporter periplasmic adaptor subunit [Acidobacteria bacterium]|nr:efflux RND transporter periplasmic adaptor subunit [Acidobacteriota bacterium]
MDVPRSKTYARNKKIRRVVYLVLGLALVGGISVVLARLQPAAQTVERATVVIDAVKRGDVVIQRRGLGQLVPEDIIFITAMTNGRVEKKLLYNGDKVTPDSVILVLSNPDLQKDMVDAESQYNSAKAAFENRKVEIETQLLAQRAGAAQIKAAFESAKLEAESYEKLYADRVVSEMFYKQRKMAAEELKTRNELEHERLAKNTEAMNTQLAVAQATLEQAKAQYEFRKTQFAALNIKAGIHGVLQEVLVQPGAQVQAGTNLARVSDPKRLKAEVQIVETQARDVLEGQRAEIDTRNGVGFIPGRVLRKDPSVVNGTVMVTVQLLGDLPPDAIPYMSVDGTIEVARMDDVLYVQRPTFGQDDGTIKLFRLDPDERHANAVPVQLGRLSVTVAVIKSGLQVGDKVIVSDTQQLGDTNRIRLN